MVPLTLDISPKVSCFTEYPQKEQVPQPALSAQCDGEGVSSLSLATLGEMGPMRSEPQKNCVLCVLHTGEEPEKTLSSRIRPQA